MGYEGSRIRSGPANLLGRVGLRCEFYGGMGLFTPEQSLWRILIAGGRWWIGLWILLWLPLQTLGYRSQGLNLGLIDRAFTPTNQSRTANSDAVVAQDTSGRSGTNLAAKSRVRQMVDDAGSLLLGMINWEGKAVSAVPTVMKALPKVCKAVKTSLQEVVEGSRMEGKHLVYDLDDGGKVFIRKESHALPQSGGADVPHSNIEVMRPRYDRLGKPLSGQYRPILDTHITLDPSGKPDGIIHTGPKAPKQK